MKNLNMLFVFNNLINNTSKIGKPNKKGKIFQMMDCSISYFDYMFNYKSSMVNYTLKQKVFLLFNIY